jgi:hypothetical protein
MNSFFLSARPQALMPVCLLGNLRPCPSLNLQRLNNNFFRKTGKLHVPFKIFYVYDMITKSFRQQAEVI